MLNIALFGPPGAGKGTQSEFLIQEYNLYHVSTGDLLRREIANKTRLGLEAQSIIAAGGLVSDEIIVQIIEKTITDNPNCNGFLFDGFPRTYIQSYILEGLMLKLNTSLNCLISLELSEEESVKRLLNRGKISGRSDDNETVICNRLKEYKEKTLPVLQFYKDKGIYHEVDGARSIEAVTELLELPKHVLPLFGLCLGWPADNPDIKPRLPASLVVHENQYQPLNSDVLAQYDEQLAQYYLTRGSNTRRDTWSDHIRRTIIKESRPFILEYLHKQGWATR